MTYERLTSIPLFTGISGDDLARIMDRVELIDVDLLPGERFVGQGDVCHGLAIVRDGVMQRKRVHDCGFFQNGRGQQTPLSYEVTELIEAPFIIEPEIIFGLSIQHKSSWTANSTCQLTLIRKEDIRQTLMHVPVWRINFVNMICTTLQRSLEATLPQTIQDTRQTTIDYLLRHCSLKGKTITFESTLEQFSFRLGMTRTTTTNVLEMLEKEQLIQRQKNRIIIPDIQKLCQNI